MIASERRQVLGQLVARAALQLADVAVDVDREDADQHLRREAEAIEEGANPPTIASCSVSPWAEVDAADLEHGAILATGEQDDLVLDRLQAESSGLHRSTLAHRSSAVSSASAAAYDRRASSSSQALAQLPVGRVGLARTPDAELGSR